MKYWLNPRVKSAKELEAETKKICDLYEQVEQLAKRGIKVYSTDECTGIQALERKAPTKLMKVGKVRRVEHEYKRHGTLNLIANFEIVSGRVENSTISPTRTEVDFLGHIKRTIDNNEEATGWWFVVDHLNTHQSASLVRLVAQLEGIKENELGEKGKSGSMKSMASRGQFLEAEGHRLRFIYTPKHCSWLNQVELWFSILTKKLLKWGNFKSTEDLQRQMEKFIEYFNETMAKPFKWTFKGFPLRI